jgi:hypothetical protein
MLRRNSCHPDDGGDIATLMMEAIYSSETSILARTALRYTPEDGILPFYAYLEQELYGR